MAFVGKRQGPGMKGVELYAQVRYAVQIEGVSRREAARRCPGVTAVAEFLQREYRGGLDKLVGKKDEIRVRLRSSHNGRRLERNLVQLQHLRM
jgi:hypothetical protein